MARYFSSQRVGSQLTITEFHAPPEETSCTQGLLLSGGQLREQITSFWQSDFHLLFGQSAGDEVNLQTPGLAQSSAKTRVPAPLPQGTLSPASSWGGFHMPITTIGISTGQMLLKLVYA